MPRFFYEGTDSEFLQSSLTFSSAITGSPATYGLTAAQATAYADAQNNYAGAYANTSNPGTRTRAAVATKDQMRAALESISRQFSDYIIREQTVSDSQLIELGLPPRSGRQPTPVPEAAPRVEVLSVSGRNISIRLWDSQVARRGKPPGTSGAAIFSYVGATAPANIADWKFEGNVGRVKQTIPFDDSIPAGATVWLTAFWFNGRKESGPACDPVSVTFGGVGVSLAENDMKLAA